MKKKHINYLIEELRFNRSVMRSFWKSFPEGKKQCPDSVATYNLQLEIIRELQALKGQ